MDEQLEASVSADTLTLNGEDFDFSRLQEGGILPMGAVDSAWVASAIERVNGDICLTLRIPHGANAPAETLYPDGFKNPIFVNSGQVPIPPYSVAAVDISGGDQ